MTTGEDATRPTSVTAPRRGKFLSAPSSSSTSSSLPNAPKSTSPSNKSRGKVLGKPPSPSVSSLSAATGAANQADGDADSLAQLRTCIHDAKVAAVDRRKALASRRDRIFDDLNKAENIVLSLLDCASEVSGALSDMTTAKAKRQEKEGSSAISGEDGDGKTFEDLTVQVRSYGEGYLAGVKKLHQLLAPHASLVKSYRNHDADVAQTTVSAPTHQQQSTTEGIVASKSITITTIKDQIVERATSNMYAAKVEKRLAVERSEILKEMIRLEESDGADATKIEGAGAKRKHEA